MTIDSNLEVRGAGLLRSFSLETGATSIDQAGTELLAWLDRKFSGNDRDDATAERYKSWLLAYLSSLPHPCVSALQKWVPGGSSGIVQASCGIASMPGVSVTTIDSAIQNRATGLISSFAQETGALSVSDDAEALIGWLNEKVETGQVSLVSAKCYRRWLAQYFESVGHPCASVMRSWRPPTSKESVIAEDVADSQSLAAMTDLQSTESNDRYYAYLGSESLKLLLEQLVEVIPGSGRPRYKNGEEIALFMIVSAMTGLRPTEWLTARYHTSYYDADSMLTLGPVLEVKTLKQSGRREDNPLKPNRFLVLDRWPEIQLQRLQVMLEIVARELTIGGDEGFVKYLKRNREQLRRAWDRLVKKKGVSATILGEPTDGPDASPTDESKSAPWVTFYTCRHIFAEEVRRSQSYTRFELAALMGHSLLANQTYYGPRDKSQPRGFDFVLPRPWPGDSDEIRLWDYKVNPYRMRSPQGDLFGSDYATAEQYANQVKSGTGLDDFYLR